MRKRIKVTNTQARNIQSLLEALTDFDKKPLIFKPRVHQKLLIGHFARAKSNRVGHIGVDAMKR